MRFKEILGKWLKRSYAPDNLWGPVYGYSYRQRLGYEDAFELVAWVHRAVRVISTNIQQVQVKACIKKRTRSGDKLTVLPDEHPFAQLLRYPNDEEDMKGLLEATATHLCLRGEALWEVEAAPTTSGDTKKGTPTRLYNYPPQFINRAIIDKNKYAGFELIVNGHKFTIPADDTCFFKYYNPRNPWRGIGPMGAAFQAAETDYNATKFNKRWFDSAISPSVVVKYNDKAQLATLDPTQRERLRTEIQRIYGGVDKSQNVMVLGPGQDVENVGQVIKDMSFKNLRQFGRDEILACFGVPGIMAGVIEDVNRANGEETRAMFWEETMLPIIDDIASMVNRKISPRYGPDVYAHFDVSGVPALRKNMKALTEWLIPTIDSGVITINEARTEYFQKPPVPWGDDWFKADNENAVGGEEDAADGVPGEGAGDKKPKPTPPADAGKPPKGGGTANEGGKDLQPSQVRALISEWKNAVVQRIKNGAKSPMESFPCAREARRAAGKYRMPQEASWDLAHRIFTELSLVWDVDYPADCAAKLFDEYLAEIPKEDVHEEK